MGQELSGESAAAQQQHQQQQHGRSTSKEGSNPQAPPQGQKRPSLDDVCYFEKNVQMLGKGSFGTVYKGCLRADHRNVAVKMIDKEKMTQLKVSHQDVVTECEMMRECVGQERFVQLYTMVETNSKFCLITEFCDGGNIQDGAMSVEGNLGESQVRLLMRQMLEAIAYLHSRNICHRDIKPHNYFLQGHITSPSVKVKLGDFGSAMRLPQDKLITKPVGTPCFMAPEIHLLPDKSSGYDHKVDVWAVGVCMIFLLANEYPFIDGQGRLLREKIIAGRAALWEANSFANLFQGFLGISKKRPSNLAINLTRTLLSPCPSERPSSFAALKHEWFTRPILSDADDNSVDNLPLLDMKDFEKGFVKIMHKPRGVSNVDELAFEVNSGLSDITNFFSAALATQDNVKVMRTSPSQRLPPPSMPQHVLASTQRQRSLHAGTPRPVQAGPPRSLNACCLCGTEPSMTMLDHVCPCCRAPVCAACICQRLPQDDLRCPACHDSRHNVENMRLVLGLHEAGTSIGSFMVNILGGFGDAQPQKNNMKMAAPVMSRAPAPPQRLIKWL